MKLYTIAAIGMALLGGVCELHAQEPTPVQQVVTVYELALRDGSRLYGAILRQDEHDVVFRTEGGTTVTVARAEILSLKETSGVRIDGEFLPSDKNVTRLFFGPTGRALRRGQSYLGVYEFGMPFVQVGLTDRISVGGGTPLVIDGSGTQPFWVTPKVQLLAGERTQVAAGVFHGFAGGDDFAGVAYVVGTHGNTAQAVTIGVGVGYAGGGGTAPILMVGGERQVRRNMKIVSENYLWKGGNGVASLGVRFFGERLSADLGLGIPIGADFFITVPVVNFVYIF